MRLDGGVGLLTQVGLWSIQTWGGWTQGLHLAVWTWGLLLAQLGMRGLAQGTAGSLGSW